MHRETLQEMSCMPLASERSQAFLLYIGWVFNYGFRWGPVLRFVLFSVFSFDVAADTYKTDGCQVRLIRPNRAISHFLLFLKDFENVLHRDSKHFFALSDLLLKMKHIVNLMSHRVLHLNVLMGLTELSFLCKDQPIEVLTSFLWSAWN